MNLEWKGEGGETGESLHVFRLPRPLSVSLHCHRAAHSDTRAVVVAGGGCLGGLVGPGPRLFAPARLPLSPPHIPALW